MSIIGERIKKYRILAGLKQSELAEKLNVTNRAVSNWESGKNGIDSNMISTLCEVLGVSPNDLIVSKADPQPSPETIALARRIEALDAAGREFVETCVSFAESRIVRPA